MKPLRTLQRFEHHFRAMGTDVGLWLWNNHEQRARSAFASVESFFVRAEARLSRFLPQSELSRLNGAAGQPFPASRTLYDLVERALAWRTRTGGIFDPTVLNALVACGYDRPFDALRSSAPPDDGTDSGAQRAEISQGAAGAAAHAIALGPGSLITLPPGVGLDLGGIAKGWAVQEAAHRLGMWGSCLVDAGGDIACTGAPPAGPWVVSVADPLDPERDIAVLTLSNEAVATSSRAYRQWHHKGRPAHHLIDPRTGAPAETGLLAVTVLAPRLPDAEVHAKTALILGEKPGLAYLGGLPGISAILVTDDGRRLFSGRLEDKAYVPSHPFADRFRYAA
jgi:thiamine biosynthesis lipoprotein